MLDKVEVKKEDTKEVPGNIKVAEAKEEPKAAVKEEPEVKEEPKAAPKRTGYLSEIDGVEVDFELQYRDQETDMKDIARRVTEDYVRRGNDASGIELIQVYLKPTDFTAYYVINNSYEGKIPLF